MRLKNTLQYELWLWSMQREKFSDLQKRLVSDVPAAKRRTRFMLRRLTVINFSKGRSFEDEIHSMADEFDAQVNSNVNSEGEDETSRSGNNTDRR